MRIQPTRDPGHPQMGAGWRGGIRISGHSSRNRMLEQAWIKRNAVIAILKHWHALCVFTRCYCLDIDNLFGSEFGVVRTARGRRIGDELLTTIHCVFSFS